MSVRSLLVFIFAFAITLLLAPRSGEAEPQFAIRYAAYSKGPMRCSNCHVNPTGSGIRNKVGKKVFIESLMAMDTALLGGPTQYSPTLGEDEWFRYGGDLRLLFLRRKSTGAADLEHRFPQPGDESLDDPTLVQTSQGFFFPMELELESAMEFLDGDLNLLVPFGFPNLELTAIYSGVPWDGWVKGGRFYPSYGIRTANHTMYHRTLLGYDPIGHDLGLEAGFYPTDNTRIITNLLVGKQPCQVQWEEARAQELGIHESDVVCDTATTRYWKEDEDGNWGAKIEAPFIFFGQGAHRPLQAASVVADWTKHVSEKVTMVVGGSTYGGYFDDTKVLKAGPYLMLNIGSGTGDWNLTYLGEFDYMRVSPLEPSSANIGVSFQELTLTPIQGLDLITSVETYDPDLKKDGDGIMRFAFGTQLFATRWSDLRLHYRFTQGDLALNHRANERDFIGELHLFF